jgi:hypothetical protein
MQKSAIVDFLFALLTTRHFASCSVKSWHLSFTNPREAIFIILLAFSLLGTSQVQGLSSQALIPRIPEMREVNEMLTPFSRQLVSTCQSCGTHQEILPHVLSCSAPDFATQEVVNDSFQPMNSQTPDTRCIRMPDPMVVLPLWLMAQIISQSRDSGLRDSKSQVFHLQTCESLIHEMVRSFPPVLFD